jgi:hypothetical protein
MNPQHFRRFRSHVQDEEIEPRADCELWCVLRERDVLLVDGVCFSRLRNAKCSSCVHDREFILVKLVWHLADFIEDSEEGRRHSTHG